MTFIPSLMLILAGLTISFFLSMLWCYILLRVALMLRRRQTSRYSLVDDAVSLISCIGASRLPFCCIALVCAQQGDVVAFGSLLLLMTGAHCQSDFACRFLTFVLVAAMLRNTSRSLRLASLCYAVCQPVFPPKKGRDLILDLTEAVLNLGSCPHRSNLPIHRSQDVFKLCNEALAADCQLEVDERVTSEQEAAVGQSGASRPWQPRVTGTKRARDVDYAASGAVSTRAEAPASAVVATHGMSGQARPVPNQKRRSVHSVDAAALGLADLRFAAVSEELRSFVHDTFNCRIHAREAGGGGDCFFFAVAAALRSLALSDPVAKRIIEKRITDRLGHDANIAGVVMPLDLITVEIEDIMPILRKITTQQFLACTDEELLEHMIMFRNDETMGRSVWRDEWSPALVLTATGLGGMLDVHTVLAVGENEYACPGDYIIKHQDQSGLHLLLRVDGCKAKLANLRKELQMILETTGNMHWARDLDIPKLADALDLGIIMFSASDQGRPPIIKWIKAPGYARGDFPCWITLYNDEDKDGNPVHFQVAQLETLGSGEAGVCFFPTASLPPSLVAHYNFCNSKAVGEASHGAVN